MMRLSEIRPLKHIKPLTLPQARVHKLKAEVDKSRIALKAERDSQRRSKDLEHRRKQQTTAATIGPPRTHNTKIKPIQSKNR
jgi:hypothetical protein